MGSLFTALANLFGNTRTRKAAPVRRRVHLGLEVLEGRALPSVSPILTTAIQAEMAHMVVQPTVNYVPNLQGYSFHLTSKDTTSGTTKPAHDLVIKTETYNADGSASFTGTWAGDGPNSSGTPKPISGTLKYDANGNLILSFSWQNGSGQTNSFSGTLTRIYPSPASAYTYFGAEYHLDGTVTTPTPGDGPGEIVGNSVAPPPMAKAEW